MERVEKWKAQVWIIAALIAGIILGALLQGRAYAANEPMLSPYASGRLDAQGDKADARVSKVVWSSGDEGTPAPNSEFRSIVRGRSSWYGSSDAECLGCSLNRITASGSKFDELRFTAACARRWPLGTALTVRHREKVVRVVCTDRGGFETKYGRVLDLSKAAFAKLAPLGSGVIDVEVVE